MNNQNSGIYIIEHVPTGKTYVGASSNLKKRRYTHLRSLHLGKSHNTEMLLDYKDSAIGNSAIDFRVIEYCGIDQLSDRERFQIDALKPDYNHNAGGGGYHDVTDEFRETMRKRLTGKQIRKVGTFVTPFGIFPSSLSASDASDGLISQSAVWNACRKSNIVITRNSYSKSAYLQNNHDESVVGKTWAELGFGFSAE